MRKKRKQYSSEEKVAILKRHLVNGELVADLCDELKLSPSLFYKWQATFFENGAKAFETKGKGRPDRTQQKLQDYEEKLTEKDAVISELASHLLLAKKKIGVL